MVDVDIKLVPLTVRVKPGSPTVAEFGEMLMVVGSGFAPGTTVKFWELYIPPAGVGLNTVIGYVPAVSRSDDGIEAVSWLAETNVVVLSDSLNLTLEEDTKLEPLTVKTKLGPFTNAELGKIFIVTGTGLLTKNDWAFDNPPIPLSTVILYIPPVVKSDAGIAAVN